MIRETRYTFLFKTASSSLALIAIKGRGHSVYTILGTIFFKIFQMEKKDN